MRPKLAPIFVATAVGLSACSGGGEAPENSEYTSEVAELRAHIPEVEKVLPAVDQSVELLLENLEQKLGEQPQIDEVKKQELLSPLQAYLLNKSQNSQRIFAKIALNDLVDRGEEALSTPGGFGLPSPNHFYMDCVENPAAGSGYAAGYEPLARTLGVACEYDVMSKYDAVVLFHEMVHVEQDTKVRSQENYSVYEDLSQQGIVIINSEIEAYAREIELMDVLAGGSISQAIKAGISETEVTNTIIKGLGAPETDRVRLSSLARIANAFYKNTPEEFRDFITVQYANLGKRVAEIRPDGVIIELHVNKG